MLAYLWVYVHPWIYHDNSRDLGTSSSVSFKMFSKTL